MKHSLLTVAILVIASFAVGFCRGRATADSTAISKTDTLTVYQTVSETAPSPSSFTFQRWAFFTEDHTDTLRQPYAVHDTIYVPIYQTYYERLDGRLRLWISGYNTSIDQWELDEKTVYIKNTVRKRWSFSITGGPSVIYTPFHRCPVDVGIGVTGGISYNF